MTSLKSVWDCVFSPRLIKIYGSGPVEKLYEPYLFEKWGDKVIHSLYVIWKLGVYTSPVLVSMLYYRGYFEHDGLITLSRLMTGVGAILVVSFCMRGIGRCNNPVYQNFVATLKKAHTKALPSVKQELNKYEFEFHAWPVEFDASENKSEYRKRVDMGKTVTNKSLSQYIVELPFRVIAYVAIHTFGIRLVYPGVVGFIQIILEHNLLQGRSRLIEAFRGERFKLKTADNNHIDSMFVDRRGSSPNGNTLVICCEGNAGFYEIGIAITPLEAGYSVLGWNHPGFGGSTGIPYPSQEQNAIDACIQFSIQKLGFRVENIILFAWSIGGYTASWAAMSYPECRGVVLDATFDDILPLAVTHMPKWWEPVVAVAIRNYVDLNVAAQLLKYPGPVLLIRRTDDEVICTRDRDITSNRGNDLLVKLLKSRYPCVFDDMQTQILRDYLSVTLHTQDNMLRKFAVDDKVCTSLLLSYISEHSKAFPMRIGEDFGNREKSQMALFLVSKYQKDYKGTHCESLRSDMFVPPWDVSVEPDFVYT